MPALPNPHERTHFDQLADRRVLQSVRELESGNGQTAETSRDVAIAYALTGVAQSLERIANAIERIDRRQAADRDRVAAD